MFRRLPNGWLLLAGMRRPTLSARLVGRQSGSTGPVGAGVHLREGRGRLVSVRRRGRAGKASAAPDRGPTGARRDANNALGDPTRGGLGRSLDQSGTPDLSLRHLRGDPALYDWQHRRHLMASAGLPGVREPVKPPRGDPGAFVVVLRGRVSGLHRGAQLRQVADAGAVENAPV